MKSRPIKKRIINDRRFFKKDGFAHVFIVIKNKSSFCVFPDNTSFFPTPIRTKRGLEERGWSEISKEEFYLRFPFITKFPSS